MPRYALAPLIKAPKGRTFRGGKWKNQPFIGSLFKVRGSILRFKVSTFSKQHLSGKEICCGIVAYGVKVYGRPLERGAAVVSLVCPLK